MPAFSTEEVVRLSGLTRGQIDQLISRYSVFAPWSKSRPGKPREWLETDVFTLCLVGYLNRLGMNHSLIGEVLASTPPTKLDADRETPIEMFGDQSLAGNRQTFWIFADRGDGCTFVATAHDLKAVPRVFSAHKISGAIVIDVSALAAKIRAGGAAATGAP